MPKVSVILTVYNNKNDIMKAIESIFAQTYKDWELIIVNDGSTDGLYDVIKNIVEANKDKIIYLENPVNIGRYQSLNEGIIRANGKYICIIDSDDEYHVSKIEKQVNFLETKKTRVGIQTKYKRRKTIRVGEVTIMFRKEIIKRIGYYDSVRFAADSEFIARIKKVYGPLALPKIPELLYFSKYRKGSLTTAKITGEGGVDQRIVREKYVTEYKTWHATSKNPNMAYPLTERPFPVDPIMIKTPNTKPTEIKPPITKELETNPEKVNLIENKPAEVNPTDTKPADTKTIEIKQEIIKPSTKTIETKTVKPIKQPVTKPNVRKK